MGYTKPTAVQKACIPHMLQEPRDVLALAKTGTGKTAAFGIPLIEKINPKDPLSALILCPTRELATQVSQNLQLLGQFKGLSVTTVLGGESYRKQMDALRKGAQILVSTPGRLVDLMEQGIVKLDGIRFLVLDEADEMLSFGFQEALEFVWENIESEEAVTWLFSATMSDSVRRLTNKYLKTAMQVKLNTSEEASPQVESFAAVVYEEDKEDALCLLIRNNPEFYGIVFAQTKKQVADLEVRLKSMGLHVDSLHGDKAQADRTRVLARMKKRDVRILVATDVAARGIDIQDLTHVVNFEIPWDAETYTHRIGRTARAGKKGTVWTLVKPKEAHRLRIFERSVGVEFKPLAIPTRAEVRQRIIRNWIEKVKVTEVRPEDQELIVSILQESELPFNDEVQLQWLAKVIVANRVGGSLGAKDPRSFELRPPSSSRERSPRGDYGDRRDDSGPRRRSSSQGGGYRDRPSFRDRARDDRGGSRDDRRGDSEGRNEFSRSESSRGERSFRREEPADREPRTSSWGRSSERTGGGDRGARSERSTSPLRRREASSESFSGDRETPRRDSPPKRSSSGTGRSGGDFARGKTTRGPRDRSEKRRY